MKIILCVATLCAIEFRLILASPTFQTNNEVIENSLTTDAIAVPNGYISTPGIGTYKFHHLQQKNWNDARNTCLNEGAQLAVINSAAEESLFLTYINATTSVDQLWIGVHELFKKDDWVTVKGERLDKIGYVHWQETQPDGKPDEHCLTIAWNLIKNVVGMNDYPCDKELFFICEL